MSSFTRIIRESFLKEPLVHFLIIGIVLFFVYEALQPQKTKQVNRIMVSQGQIQQLAAQFKRVSLRVPSQQELDKLIESYIHDEVLYRQGLVLGLDIDDPVVKQRMRMKLEVLLEDLNEQAQPSDDVLLAFIEKNSDRYMADAIYSFEHIYLDITKHKDLDKNFALIKQQLADNAQLENLGDRLILPPILTKITNYDVVRLFGDEFSQGLSQLTINQWSSIVYSGYGAHIVKLTAMTPSKTIPLAMIKSEVLRDYMVYRRDQLKDKTYQSLREKYEIIIEGTSSDNKLKASKNTLGKINS